MVDAVAIGAWLLVLAPVVGLAPVAYPPLLGVWTASRADHLATIGAHRRAWHLLNAGFATATIGSGAGLVLLAGSLQLAPGWAAVLGGVAAVYLAAGLPWLTVLAIRARTTPALHELGAGGSAPGEAETLLGAATGGLFALFVLATGPTIVVLCAVLAGAGAVAVPVAVVAASIAVIATGAQVATGDTIPAVLYPPTMLLGIALLLG